MDARQILEAEARWELLLESHREGEVYASTENAYPQPDGLFTSTEDASRLKEAVLLLKQNWGSNTFFDDRGPWHNEAMRQLGLVLNPFLVIYR